MAKKRKAEGAASLPVWYAEGLRFECQPGCGGCCTSHGTHAYVYLENDEVDRLAEHLELTRRQFLRRYTTLDEGHRILKMDRPQCPFLEGTRCTVYAARPTQCRTFPFWPDHLTWPSSWSRLRSFCPGIDKGKLHSLRTIRRRIREHEGTSS